MKRNIRVSLPVVKAFVLLGIAIALSTAAFSQVKDSVKGPKPYSQVITAAAITEDGLFKVHQLDEHYFFEIPDSLLGRDMMLVTRVSKGPADLPSHMKGLGFAGDELGEGVMRFEKGPGNRIFIREISFLERSADSTSNGLYRSFSNSNVQPIVGSFPIKAFSKDGHGSVIDMTDMLNGDNEIFYFSGIDKKNFLLGNFQSDRSYVSSVRSFPLNVEVRAVKTFLRTSAAPVPGSTATPAYGASTFELAASLVLLPKEPMEARYFDPRVGYFNDSHIDYDADPQGVKTISYITRWRLQPKPEDVEKYMRGELVEPQKPIIIYIDPATPKKWVPYLIQGINDWQIAFEQAGFKNAIMGKEAPVNNPEWSLDDARHSALIYKPSGIENASGPQIHDPRSGEILETHISWYHNITKLLHDWYFVQCAVLDPRARKLEFDDSLMGQLVRFVASHEVGHTLGLSHNFGSSSTVPVDSLRSKRWVEANGHTPSIMDYARFNYVAQPEDSIGVKGLLPRIGAYDKWAIEWGYKRFPQFKTPQDEKPFLNNWIIERLKNNPYLWFADDRPEVGLRFDPRVDAEVLGDDVMKSTEYAIKNMKRLKPHILEWIKTPNSDYREAGNTYGQMYIQLTTELSYVARYIGGIMKTNKTVEQAGPVYQFVSRAKQKEAMNFLQKELFANTPLWLLDTTLQGLTNIGGQASKVSFLQTYVINQIFNKGVFDRLIDFQMERPSEAYTPEEMLLDMKKGCWTELTTHKPIDIFRRNLQTNYLLWLTSLVRVSGAPQGASRFTDATAIIREHLRQLKADIKKALPNFKDQLSIMHLHNMLDNINDALVPTRLTFTAAGG
jgi:hypothetical protein